jgi:hypothetical protein
MYQLDKETGKNLLSTGKEFFYELNKHRIKSSIGLFDKKTKC